MLETYAPYQLFAADYSCGAYGADEYNVAQVCGTSTAAPNTGLAQLTTPSLELIFGGTLLFLTLAVSLYSWRTSARKKNVAK